MQVADRTEHVTHAVLGGMSNISFGISDDPAFFQILSSALYKNPTLAMIRETICNAWDAHIDSGREDRPITITIDSEKLIIRDYGKGIPHDLIGPIYGVYGASTKKNDGRQTGGFGLGCKSPFAYTDHFEVVSFHDGVRTIYNMSKSSAEKMGKPSIVPIASFPTDETGIQVTIELVNDWDESKLKALIEQVAFNGDINVILNGNQLPKLGLSEAENGFILLNDRAKTSAPVESLNYHSIYVRYGNVVYPVERSDTIEPLFGKVTNLLSQWYNCRLVMMAPPDSISITPSRESLTMSSITTETLKKLLSNFLAHLMHNHAVSLRHKEMIKEYVDTASADETPLAKKLTIDNWKVPGVPEAHEKKFLSTTEDFALLGVLLKYSNRNSKLTASQWLSNINQYLNNLSKNGLVPRGLLSTWQQTARKAKSVMRNPNVSQYYDYTYPFGKGCEESMFATTWWHKRVMVPLHDKLSAVAGHSVRDQLYYYSNSISRGKMKAGYYIPESVRSIRVKTHTANLVHLLKPTVYLCHNNDRLPARIGRNYVAMAESNGTLQTNTYFVLEIPRKEEVLKKMQEGLQALSDSGEIEFKDLTGRTPTEESEYQDRLASASAKRKAFLEQNPGKALLPRKAKTGLVRLDQLLTQNGRFDTCRMLLEHGIERLSKPAFIEKVSTASNMQSCTESLNQPLLIAVAKLWGAQGVVTNNNTTYTKYIQEKNVMSLKAFVVDKVINEIATNPALIAHMQFDAIKAHSYLRDVTGLHRANEILKVYELLISTPEFNSLVPNYVPLTLEDELKLVVWHEALEDYQWRSEPGIQTAHTAVKDLELSQGTKDFLTGLVENPFLGLLNEDKLEAVVIRSRNDPVKMAKITAVISEIIN